MTRLDKPNPPGPDAKHKVGILWQLSFFGITASTSVTVYACSVFIIFFVAAYLNVTQNILLLALLSIILAFIPAIIAFRLSHNQRPRLHPPWTKTKGGN